MGLVYIYMYIYIYIYQSHGSYVFFCAAPGAISICPISHPPSSATTQVGRERKSMANVGSMLGCMGGWWGEWGASVGRIYVQSRKWTNGNGKTTMNEDVSPNSPIKDGDFHCHLSFRGCILDSHAQLILRVKLGGTWNGMREIAFVGKQCNRSYMYDSLTILPVGSGCVRQVWAKCSNLTWFQSQWDLPKSITSSKNVGNPVGKSDDFEMFILIYETCTLTGSLT